MPSLSAKECEPMRKRIAALCTVILCVVLSSCSGLFYEQIDADRVERIIVCNPAAECEIDADDAGKFIQLYNASAYGGKATGEGGTPDFQVSVYLDNGNPIRVNDFGALGKDLEVSSGSADWFYLNSEDLYSFMAGLVDKYLS